MATLLLSAAGAAIGAGFGGAVLGLSGAVIGRAIGATIGRAIDQQILGGGSEPVDVGRLDRLRLTGAGEGAAIGKVWGRMRVGGQVIWATDFVETVRRKRAGKGMPKPQVNEYSYSVSLAIGLCEGEILRVGRIWADGNEISALDLNMRVYTGSEDQLPDALIEAIEGSGKVPAYRGLAYVVVESLELSAFGNRVPNFSFEVVRAAQRSDANSVDQLSKAIPGVALIPGTGEYSLATTPVHYRESLGKKRSANVHSPSGKTDFATSLDQLKEELPEASSVSVVVSWFGGDLRCPFCAIKPKVEQRAVDGTGMPWRSGGIVRSDAEEVQKIDDVPIYGGTPADTAIIEAIKALRTAGKDVMFYPFVLMDQIQGNSLPDPWTGELSQPSLPWRGRITLTSAPGRPGTPDRTASAADQVSTFFGSALPEHFSIDGELVSYSGPEEWGYRRFILHYASLCAASGGVESFCIGSELRSLTQVRAENDVFPAVMQLKRLADDVRAILGPSTKIGYAADWFEYFGYHADENVYFNLDDLWSHNEIDFVGIDNYMPLSDWRDTDGHADSQFEAIYSKGYLKSNIAGGEGFDWYYASANHYLMQSRTAIEDPLFQEPWIFRYKDIRSWWSNPHYERREGVRALVPTTWTPESKPIRFTEYGCPAVNKGTNQPNRFLDERSSESALPMGSNGQRDDLIQMQYFVAMSEYWRAAENNPESTLYSGPMVDFDHCFAWAWDSRPYPEFPGRGDIWSDSKSYSRGHWLNGRASSQALSAVVDEVCWEAGLTSIDVERLFGIVRGYQQSDIASARSTLQPLMLAFGFDAYERDGRLIFKNRSADHSVEVANEEIAVLSDDVGRMELMRSATGEISGQVRFSFIDAESSFEARAVEGRFSDEAAVGVSATELPIALTQREAVQTVDRWFAEARIARDSIKFGLPRSRLEIGAGDVVRVSSGLYRIDRVEQTEMQALEGVRVEPGVYVPGEWSDDVRAVTPYSPPVPVEAMFLDLPLLTGQEVPHAPYLAATSEPWTGSVAVWSSSDDSGYEVNRLVAAPACMGVTETPLSFHPSGQWDLGPALRVKMVGGDLAASERLAVLNGSNVMAIGDGSIANWEIFQFADAQLVAPDTYALSVRLRGQAGSDSIMPDLWPIGSQVVLLDLAVNQIELSPASRGLERHYRIGAAARGYDDLNVTHLVAAFDGNGLRPYSVAHLKAELVNDVFRITWVRRSRIDADTWQSSEVPLAETSEDYVLRVTLLGAVVAEYRLSTPEFLYTPEMRSADGVDGLFEVSVAQVSTSFGPGPFRTLTLSG